ncbi:hypothetical protein E4U48_005241 [Claviceps purpurea]|nr:hypothetical protein E4U48_005241 [Claviceps purpurea]
MRYHDWSHGQGYSLPTLPRTAYRIGTEHRRHPRRDLEDSSITSPSFLPRRSRLSRLLRSTTDTATATATDTDIDTDTDTDTDTELRPASLSLPIDGPSLVSRHMHSQHAKDRAPPKPPKC